MHLKWKHLKSEAQQSNAVENTDGKLSQNVYSK